jgi:iron(III) transport system substrate-binding protein
MSEVSRRRFLATSSGMAAVAALAACGAGPSAPKTEPVQTETGADLVKSATAEGQVVWYTSISTGAAAVVAAAFKSAYPGISVQYIQAQAETLSQRFLSENSAGKHYADVFHDDDYGVMTQAKNLGYLAKYIPPNAASVIAPRYIDPSGYWWSIRVLTDGILYNTTKVSAADVPSSWPDLLTPFWTGGKLGLLDPRQTSGEALRMYELSQQPGLGPAYFEKLAADKPLFYAGSGQVSNALTTGEIAGGVSTDYVGWQLAGSGAPVRVAYPKEGVGVSPDYVAVTAQAPHPYAGRLFSDFLLSSNGMTAMAKGYGGYVSDPTVLPYPRVEGRPKLSDLKLFPLNAAADAAAIPQFLKNFTTWFG